MFQIEKNVPMPKPKGSGNAAPALAQVRYPITDMGVGDSFFIPGEQLPAGGWKNARRAIEARARRVGIRIVAHQQYGGLRVWRAA